MTDNENWRNELTKGGAPRKRSPYVRGPKWEPKNIELIPHVIPQEEYDLNMRLLAEVLLEEFQRQALLKKPLSPPEPETWQWVNFLE